MKRMIFLACFLIGYHFCLVSQPEYLGKNARLLMEYINEERIKIQISTLEFNEVLTKIAAAHNQKMAKEKKLSHEFPGYKALDQRLADAGLFFMASGENIAFSDTYVAGNIHEGFMKSPPHKKNILGPDFSHGGVDILETAEGFYTTQVFAKLTNTIPVSVAEARLIHFIESKFILSLDYSPKMAQPYHEQAQQMAQDYFMTGDKRSLPGNFGVHNYYFVIGSNIDLIEDYLTEKIPANPIISFTLGLNYDRNNKYSGGAYTACLIIFPDLLAPAKAKSDSGAADYMLGIIKNQFPQTKHWVINPKLSKKASIMAKKYFQHEKYEFRFQYSYVYQTASLDSIPPKLDEFITAFKEKTNLGLAVFYPPAHQLNGNYIIIALIL